MTEKEFVSLLESIENDSYTGTYKNDDIDFLNKMNIHWGKAFQYSDEIYNKSLAYTELKRKQYVENYEAQEGSIKIKTVQLLLARSLTTYLGIVTLIKNGFAEQAESGCRTLLELEIILVFILDNPEDVAEQYYIQAHDPKKKIMIGLNLLKLLETKMSKLHMGV